MNNNWYVEVRTKRTQPVRNEARGGTVKVRYDAEKLSQQRLRIALDDARENGVKVTPKLEAQWLADIRVAVAEWIERKS